MMFLVVMSQMFSQESFLSWYFIPGNRKTSGFEMSIKYFVKHQTDSCEATPVSTLEIV